MKDQGFDAVLVPLVASIHMGPWKTGTTSLQSILTDSRETLLRRGVYYPPGIGTVAAHHELANWLQGTLPRLGVGWSPVDPTMNGLRSYVRFLVAEARSRGAHTLVLSSEDLAGLASEDWRRLLGMFREAGVGEFRLTHSDFTPEERLQSYANQYVLLGEVVDEKALTMIRHRLLDTRNAILATVRSLSDEEGLTVRSLQYSNRKDYLSELVDSVLGQDVTSELGQVLDRVRNRSLEEIDRRLLNAFNRLNTEGREFNFEAPVTFSNEFPFAQRRLRMVRDLIVESRRLRDHVEVFDGLLVEVEDRRTELRSCREELTAVYSSRTWRVFKWYRIWKSRIRQESPKGAK